MSWACLCAANAHDKLRKIIWKFTQYISSSAKLWHRAIQPAQRGFRHYWIQLWFCCEQAFHWPFWSFEGSSYPNSGLHFRTPALCSPWKQVEELFRGRSSGRLSISLSSKKKLIKQKLSRSWEVQPPREARCCHCSSAESWLKERGFCVDSQPCASLVCDCKLCLCCPWQPTLRVGDGRQVFLCQDPLRWRDVEQAKLGTAFLAVSCALPLLLLCRSECDLCPLLSQAQTTDMESPLANPNFQCTLKVQLCLNPAEDREEQKVRFYLSPFNLGRESNR